MRLGARGARYPGRLEQERLRLRRTRRIRPARRAFHHARLAGRQAQLVVADPAPTWPRNSSRCRRRDRACRDAGGAGSVEGGRPGAPARRPARTRARSRLRAIVSRRLEEEAVPGRGADWPPRSGLEKKRPAARASSAHGEDGPGPPGAADGLVVQSQDPQVRTLAPAPDDGDSLPLPRARGAQRHEASLPARHALIQQPRTGLELGLGRGVGEAQAEGVQGSPRATAVAPQAPRSAQRANRPRRRGAGSAELRGRGCGRPRSLEPTRGRRPPGDHLLTRPGQQFGTGRSASWSWRRPVGRGRQGREQVGARAAW